MKRMIFALATLGVLSMTGAQAQSMNKTDGDPKQVSPGTTGAMGNVNANGVATDPGGVQAQQGDISKTAPGTVGAAPGAEPSTNQK